MLPALHRGLVLTTLFVALAIAAPPTAVGAEHRTDPAYTTEDVSFENDGLTLHGTVLVPSPRAATATAATPTAATPPSAAPRHPAVVIVGGSGARERSAYLAEARAFAASGVVTLVYDKRTVGYSLTERSFEQLGDDAIAGLRMLQARADVDPTRVGLWGHSEGGWVVPAATATHPEVGFVILAAASALPPAEVQTWSTCRYLVHAGFPERLCAPVGGNLTRLMIAGGLFPEDAFDPMPFLAQLRVPTLVLLAEFDRSTAPVTSGQRFAEALEGSPEASVCVIPGADHGFRASSDGFTADERFADGYLQLAPEWVTTPGDGSFGCPATAQAHQVGAPTPPRPLDWYETLPLQAGAVIALLVAFLSYPISAVPNLLRRMRRMTRMRAMRASTPAAKPARLLSAMGLTAVLGTICLLGYIMATGATDPIGPALLGRPAVWLLLQLLSLGVVGAAIWTATTWWRHRTEAAIGQRVRLGSILAGAVIFVPWAAWWGLFTV